MNNNSLDNNGNGQTAEIEMDMREIFSAIWQKKVTIIIISTIAVIISVFYALSLPNTYKSQVLLTPAEESQSGGLAALAGQFGGLASLAGVNLKGGGTDKTQLAIETLKTRKFLSGFIKDNNLAPTLMAVKDWDMQNNKLIYNLDKYNVETGQWLRDVKLPRKPKPSGIELHEHFLKHNLSVSQDLETGLVQLSVKHFSPYVAQEIVTKLVIAINKKMKEEDVQKATKSIEYLTESVKETQTSNLKQIFYQLIEQQIQTKMLATVRDEYALKVIDPAIVPELKDGPKRALIVILSLFIALITSIGWVLIRLALKRD
jgi:uncharacterized protein involved in exopolysaccharide biosynthesis